MGSSEQLYNRIVGRMESIIPYQDIRHLKNLLWIVVGIVQQESVHLSKIAQSIPGQTTAQSRVTKIRRWLMNEEIDVWQYYEPMLEQVLKSWKYSDITVIVDGVMVFGDRLQIFRLSLAHGCRAIPLIWRVIPGKGLTTVEALEPIFEKAAEFLRNHVASVTLLADRGFRDCDWAALCLSIGWHYNIRITDNTIVWLEDGTICRIDELKVKVGKPKFYQNVALTSEGEFETNLSVTWTEDGKELVAIISDKPANRARLNHYSLRMHIEESFRDDKSSGFDLEHSRLQHVERLERLLLAEAIAVVWCHELGERCVKSDDMRRLIDPAWQRELSIFQLGLRWLHRCLATAIHLLPHFLARLCPIRLKPVVKMAS
jgi:DDE family transposase